MKKLLLTLVIAFFAMIQGFSQTPIAESFEGTFPPEGWTITGFTQNVARGVEGPGSKSAMLDYSAFDGRIILPSYVATEHTVFSFYVGAAYASYAADNVFTVEVSTSVDNPSWQTIQNISYPTNDYDFLYNEINLSAYAGQEILVSLHVIPNYGASSIVDMISLYEMTCPRPTELVVTNVTNTSAQLSWTSVTEANEYALEVLSGSDDWANATVYTLTETSYSLTELPSGTTFQARVKSLCDDNGESTYTPVLTFGTSCAESITTLPFIDQFNNLNCWTIMIEGNYSGYIYPEIGEEFSGNGTMLQTGANAMIALASHIDFDVTNAEIIFPLRAYEGYATPVAQVGYVTDLQDTLSFVPMEIWQIQNSDHWEDYVLNTSEWILDEDSTYYIAIKFMPGTYGSMYMDNFKIQEMPDCPAPIRTSVNVQANATNAIVTWVDNNPDHEAWNVYYRIANSEEEVEWQEESATEQSLTITDLIPETTYEVYVKTDCGTGNENTDQTYTVTFTTTPAPITLPYFQDFEDITAVSEFDYHTYDYYDERNEWKIGNAVAYLEEGETTGNSMYISSDNGATHSYINQYCYSIASILVEFTPGFEYRLEFDYLVNGEAGSDIFRVFVLDATTPLDQYYNGDYLTNELSGVTSWSHFSAGIPSQYIGTTKQILFYWKNDSYDVNQPPAAIDNIRIIPTTCLRPTSIEITEITGSTATIEWQGTADQFNVEYYPTSNPSEVTIIETSENNVTITELESATSYTFRLQSICDEEVSPVTSTYSFFTSCDPITTPFWFEDFESVYNDEEAANLKFSCWNVLQSTGGSYNGSFPRIYWEGYSQSAHSGEVTLEFKGDGLLLLPDFAYSTDELQLSFYANTTASTAEEAGVFEVGYVTDPMDTASFVPVSTVAPVGFERSSSVLVGPFVFTDATDDARIALRYRAVVTGDLESWNLDDFTVQPVSNCPAPNFSSVTITEVTDNQATVSWVDENESHTQWSVFYKTAAEEEYTVVMATEQTIELTGLEPATSYLVYVQTYCGEEENYDRTAEVVFSTKALPVSEFPYMQDFQNLEENPFNVEYYGDEVNKWMVGTATGAVSAEDPTSVYISNNQSNYAYVNTTSHSYIVMPIQFGDAAEYSISFDYKVGGESSYDYLSVVLCDGNAEITNSTTGTPTGEVILNKKSLEYEWTTATYTSSTLAGAYKLLVFYWYNDYGGGDGMPAAIDNIRIIGANCPAPASFVLDSKTSNSATFSWAADESTSWTLYYKLATESEYTAVDVAENPFTLTGLEPQTDYSAYLVTNCEGEESAPSQSVSFKTDCAAIDEFPYYEGFETVDMLCWNANIVLSNGNDNNWESVTSASQYTPSEGNRFVIFQASGNGASARLVSPIFDMSTLTAPYVKFNYVNRSWSGDQDILKVQYRSNSTEEWIDLATYNTNVSSWITDSIALPNQSDTYQISFLGVSNYGYGTALDAFTVYDASAEQGGTDPEEPQPCDAPTNLTVNNITANSADVTWNGTAETYELKLNGGEAETLTTTSKQLIGLPENFTITVEVRSICGNQQSEWVSTTFTTLDGEDPEPQPCDAPTNLSASNITETSAEITWNGTATTYEFKVNGGEAETLTTTTKTLTGLTENTAYTVEVRSICEDQTSDWVSTNFTTIAAPIVIVLGEVTTSPATNVGNTSATLNGALVSAGESENFTVGFALSTTADFTLEDAGVENITATLNANTFSQAVNDLVEGQTYFYRAYITNEAGTAYGAVETFTLSSLAEEIAGALQVSLYPNPAQENATMEIVGLDQDAKIVISDLQGRILSQEAISAGETHYTINVSNMASGVYYIRIVTDKAVSTQKLIVE
ncbi:MAG: fibronectin type III domain-containing protein [Bacteroidales bacterium]|nr:fibronectin type III domain-containing protein [Bacteroidales bacterium]